MFAFRTAVLCTTDFMMLLLMTCKSITGVYTAEGQLYLQHSKLQEATFTSDRFDVFVDVDTEFPLSHVEKYFISFNIDCQEFSLKYAKMNFSSEKLRTLSSAMSPALLRVGGSPADWLFFDKPLSVLQAAGLRPHVAVITKQDIANLVKLTRASGNRLLFDVNLQLRFGQQWDPSNAIDLFEFCSNEGFCDDIDWELGNEPEYNMQIGQLELSPEQIATDHAMFHKVLQSYPCFSRSAVVGPDIVGTNAESKEPSVYASGAGQFVISPEQIGKDFVTFHRVLGSYPCFNKSRVVGPDIFPVSSIPGGQKMIQAVANKTGDFLRAITFHHYYFRGDIATYKDYLNPAHFPNLAKTIDLVQSTVSKSKYPNLPIWIGETSDAWHSGTANVSDRFVSGFLWLDKLGFSAQRGIGVVMRQTLYGYNYALLDVDMNPNPDYWLSLLHRQLVGTVVLNVTLTGAPNTTRIYAHCTRMGGMYEHGAVTVFGLNIHPTSTSDLVFSQSALHQQPIDVYMLSPYDGILSKYVILNKKQRLMMVSDTELPTFKPARLQPGSKVTLEPLTFGFFVFPEANIKICTK